MTAVFVFRESQEITKHWIGTLDGSSKRSLNRRQCCPTAPSQNITHATNSVAIPEALALSKGHIGVCTKNVLYESGGCSQSPSPENRRTRVWMLFITLTTLLGHPCLSNSPSLLGAKVMLVSSITQMLSTWRRSFSLSRRREAMAEVKVVNHDHNSRNLRLLTGFGAPALQSSNPESTNTSAWYSAAGCSLRGSLSCVSFARSLFSLKASLAFCVWCLLRNVLTSCLNASQSSGHDPPASVALELLESLEDSPSESVEESLVESAEESLAESDEDFVERASCTKDMAQALDRTVQSKRDILTLANML